MREDWRADVLTTAPDGARRVAFEAQLSAQTLSVTVERQRRYHRDGIEGVWLFGKFPGGTQVWADLPMFELVVAVPGHPEVRLCPPQAWSAAACVATRPVGTFVHAWLTGRPAVRKMIRVQDEWPHTADIIAVQCVGCSQPTAFYVMDYATVTACGLTHAALDAIRGESWDQLMHYRAFYMRGVVAQEFVAAALTARGTLLASGEPVTVVPYFADDGRRRFDCHRCHTPIPYDQVVPPVDAARVLARVEIPVPAHPYEQRTYELPHWCLAGQERQCPDTHELRDAGGNHSSSWPGGEVRHDVDAVCWATGWHKAGDIPGMPRDYGSVWVNGDVRVAAPVGGTTTEPAIRQILATFEKLQVDVFWFVDPATLERFPKLRTALIPVVPDYGRLEYASAGYPAAFLRVDAGDGHLVPLRDAVRLLFQSCVERKRRS